MKNAYRVSVEQIDHETNDYDYFYILTRTFDDKQNAIDFYNKIKLNKVYKNCKYVKHGNTLEKNIMKLYLDDFDDICDMEYYKSNQFKEVE